MKKLPIADKAEQGLLGSMLLDPDAIGKVSYIREEYFYHPYHQVLYKSLIEMYVNNMTMDTLLIRQYLIEKDRLEQAGGENYLFKLMDSTLIAAHSQHYAKKVEEAYNLRKDISILEKGLNSLYNWEDGAADQVISNLTSDSDQEDNIPLDKMAEKFVEDCSSGNCGHLSWWCDSWNKKLGMMDSSSTAPLVLLNSPRSTGKTALTLQWIWKLHEEGKRVAFASIEMLRAELLPRLIAYGGKVDTWNMRTRGHATRDEIQKSTKAIKQIKDLNFCIKDKGMSVDDIRSFCISESRKGQLDALFVDNLLTISAGSNDYVNRTIFYDYIISRFKDLRDELNIPIVILCHPTGDKVAYSSNCENLADTILFLINIPNDGMDVNGIPVTPDYETNDQDVVCKFTKNRQGISPAAKLSFNKNYQTFEHNGWIE